LLPLAVAVSQHGRGRQVELGDIMADVIQWPIYPLVEDYDRMLTPTHSDVVALTGLFPDCDPHTPPWGNVKTELIDAGHIWPDLANVQCRRLVHLLRETRTAKADEFEGPCSPAEWRKRFDVSESTFARMRKNGELRTQPHSTKRISIHRDDVRRHEKK
jgi:hypothetical protein